MLKVVGASWLQTKISTYILVGMGILGIVTLFIGEIERIDDDGNFAATVYWSIKAGLHIEFWGQGNELEEVPRGASRAYYRSDIKENGWAKLEIESNGNYPDWVQAQASGFLEGALTWQIIYWQWQNTIESRCKNRFNDCNKIREVLKSNMDIVRSRSITNEDPFWHQINMYYHQLEGLYAGYNYMVTRNINEEYEISLEDIVWLNSLSDIAIIERVLNITNGVKLDEELPGLAAAFIRLMPDQQPNNGSIKEKIIIGHNSVGRYSSMLRILKRYKFYYHKNVLPTSALVPGVSISFTGYPAAISSQNDLYHVTGPNNHNFINSGTTINNFNNELWIKVNLRDHALISPRVMAANRLANNGIDWVRFIARINSGTTPAQWSILNLAKLTSYNTSSVPAFLSTSPTPEHSLYRYIFTTIDEELKSLNFSLWRTLRRKVISQNAPGLLWTAEQLPGLTHAADQSIVLRTKGYWADYGIPHYQDMRELSGIKKMEAKYGETFSLQSSPRAILFKNGIETANNVESVIYLMRSNRYVNKMNKIITPITIAPEEPIESEDIVSNSREFEHIIQSLRTVKNHVESRDEDSVASILTIQEQEAIKVQVNEILEQLVSSEEVNSRSESESKENLILESSSEEEIDDKDVDDGSWHGLGARADLRGWLGEEKYGLLPLGVIDTKVFNTTTGEIGNFIAICGPPYTQFLETPIESLLNPNTRSKTKFGLGELLLRFRQSNLRFVSDEESVEVEDTKTETSEEQDPLDFEEALNSVVNKTIQIYAPNAVLPFEWDESNFANVTHIGHPDKWRFEPVKLSWTW